MARRLQLRLRPASPGRTQFLELEPDDPMAFVGHQMVSMAAWVADQEREVGRRRSLTDDQVQLAPAHEGRRRVGEEDRGTPGGQRKDGSERLEGGTVNICVTTASRTRPGGAETRRNMAKRTSLLGRSRPSERLTREEIPYSTR